MLIPVETARMRRPRFVLPCLLLLGLTLAALPAAASARTVFKAPCIAGQKSPECTFWSARATFIADGDTIRATIDGDRSHTEHLIRFTGINAMELYRYSKYAGRRQGACHGLEAAALVERYIKRSHWRIRLAAQRAGSVSGPRKRLRRAVWVKVGGRWTDLATLEMRAGLALWLPNGQEWAHNREYHELAERSAVSKRDLYAPTSCAAGPNDDLPLSVSVNWDADGVDGHNVSGEWIEIRNGGARPLPLRGWWVRDSWLYYGGTKAGEASAARTGVPGYGFPADAVVPALGSIRVHIGCGTDTAGDLYWCQHDDAFENVTYDGKALGDGGYLFDPHGDLRASQIYPCLTACGDPLAGSVSLDVQAVGHPERIQIVNDSDAPIDLGDHVLQERVLGKPDSFIFSHAFSWNTVIPPHGQLQLVPGNGRASSRVEYLGDRITGFADGGGQIQLRTQTNLITDCASWGRGRC
jgi:endonuclease YncB( thermonuclease family)